VNGFYTVGQDWTKMRSNYLTKFFVLGITFYGLQTVQGPTQALRVVSQLIHFTDWVPGHVHMGTMGWVAMTVCASIYYVIPRIHQTEIYSERLANLHFWLVLVGQLLFSVTMWITGIRQGWLWKATGADGRLVHQNFIETLTGNYPYWHVRIVAGAIFAAGMLVFVYNVLMTIAKGKALAAKPGEQAPTATAIAT
jgi:cytochrome c oxidase cbb3-type subunit 1